MPALTGEPAYRQVADDLRRQIASGAWPPGQQLPSATMLTKTYDVSMTVIKAAINELRVEGLVVGQQGKGVYVRDTTSGAEPDSVSHEYRELVQDLRSLRDDLRQVNERLTAVEQRVSRGTEEPH